MNIPHDLIEMGYVAAPFGIQGWVKIKTTTEYVESLNDYNFIYLKTPQGQIIQKSFANSAVRDNVFHAKFVDVNDRDQALSLRGCVVCVSRSEFAKTEEDEYYWADLIGLSVINLQNQLLGVVATLMETGANDVLVVKDPNNSEKLIPFVAQYILNVSLEQKQITVDWGLDY